jgi:microcystin-dependent protein
MTLYKWSQTASADATADSTINWSEGQSPSSVNDSARAMMAATAKYRDDIAGAIVTGGTSTAYTVTSYQVFNSLANMANQVIAFTPHATNGGTTTLNVDGLGVKPLRTSTGVELLSGMLIAGTPYVATYNNSDAVWYLQSFFGNPYNIPLGGGIDYWGITAPNSSFVFPVGQAISRTTYSELFTLFSTTYGSGDGSNTFNVPDLRGRARIVQDDMGGSAASRVTTAGGGLDGATLGAVGGAQGVTLAANQIPSLTSTGSNSISVASSVNVIQNAQVISYVDSGGGGTFVLNSNPTNSALTSTGSNSISVAYTNGSQAVTKTVPPAIVCNYILRII